MKDVGAQFFQTLTMFDIITVWKWWSLHKYKCLEDKMEGSKD